MLVTQALTQEKELWKSVKSDAKQLKKTLKKSSKDGVPDDLDESIDALAAQAAELLRVSASRAWTDAEKRTDVTVGGEVIARNVPIEYLLNAEKTLEKLRNALSKSSDLSERSQELFVRVQKLHNAVRFARQDLNARPVESPPFVDAFASYLAG